MTSNPVIARPAREHQWQYVSPAGARESARLCALCGDPDPAWLNEMAGRNCEPNAWGKCQRYSHDHAEPVESCPTCTWPSRETTGLVCQTCGWDYANGEKPRP